MIEHGPVLSTDRLEKPKRPPAPDPAPSADPPFASATLPRRWGGSNRIVVHNKGEFKLRRNGSLADMSRATASQPSQGVSANSGYNQRQAESQSPASLGVAASGNHVRQAAVANADNLRVQVPAHVVKSIVVSVLHQQGVPNPSEEILNAAIQEYYAKNPQGVSFPLT